MSTTGDELSAFENLLDEEMQVLVKGSPDQLLEINQRKQLLIAVLATLTPEQVDEDATRRCQEKHHRNGTLLHILAQRARKELSFLGNEVEQPYSRNGAPGIKIASRFNISG